VPGTDGRSGYGTDHPRAAQPAGRKLLSGKMVDSAELKTSNPNISI
jgi:hypothetical protein